MGLRAGSAVLCFGLVQLLFLIRDCAAAKVVHLPFAHRMAHRTLSPRATIETTLQNFLPQYQYFITANIGNPPQTNELLVDTGSSDSYVLATGHCKDTFYAICEGGLFNPSKSSTYVELPYMGNFKTSFSGGTGIGGAYFSDAFNFDNVTVNSFIMGLGTSNRGQFTGLLGIGFPENEAFFRGRHDNGPYPNLPADLLNQGLITSNSFSVYLDDATSSTGNILFGGYDTAKYSGDLVMLPYMRTWSASMVTEYAMPFTSVGTTQGGGSKVNMTVFPATPAILDTGSPGIYVHHGLLDQIVSELSVLSTEFRDNPHSLSCSLANLKGSVNFGFGAGPDVIIPVSISELVLPKYTAEGNRKYNSHGKPMCHFGVYPAFGITILGQYFMRSAYAFFDLDNRAGGLAPAVFETTKSSVFEYLSSGSNAGINSNAIFEDPGTFEATGSIETTVQQNPPMHTAYITSFSTLGPLASSTTTPRPTTSSKSTAKPKTTRPASAEIPITVSRSKSAVGADAAGTGSPSAPTAGPTAGPMGGSGSTPTASSKPAPSHTGEKDPQPDNSNGASITSTPALFSQFMIWTTMLFVFAS